MIFEKIWRGARLLARQGKGGGRKLLKEVYKQLITQWVKFKFTLNYFLWYNSFRI